jgi:hypothetical protein
MLGRLGCPAAGNEDGSVFPIRSGRPKKMIISAAPLLVLPEPSIVFEAIDRPGIRISFVEVPNFLGHAR